MTGDPTLPIVPLSAWFAIGMALASALVVSACAARLWLGPIVIEEYANVKVRIYRAGLQCRIEVIAASDTIQTPVTQCTTMPIRQRTNDP